MDDLSETLARVCRRLEQLEDRVSAIEQMPQPAISLPVHNVVAQAQVSGAEYALPQPAGVFPVVGRAMLGIAGAYVLRAVAESGAVPKLAVVILALLYGGTWLVWATRLRVATRFASTTYALTAGLILAPMLGELTLRFHILPSPVTAALLGAFVLAATVLAWKRKLSLVVWVGRGHWSVQRSCVAHAFARHCAVSCGAAAHRGRERIRGRRKAMAVLASAGGAGS